MSDKPTVHGKFWDAVIMGAGLGIGTFLAHLILELIRTVN
jgi:hypothetical protein